MRPYLYPLTLVAIVLGFFVQQLPNLNHPFRGEHWALCASVDAAKTAPEANAKMEMFSCDSSRGVGKLRRYIPLAFFVPGSFCLLLGAKFAWFHLSSWLLHLLSAAIAVLILKRLRVGEMARLAAFALICFSFYASETLDWTLFTYIQTQSFLVTLAIFLFVLWHQEGKSIYLHGVGAAIVLASLLYEATLAIFIPFTFGVLFLPSKTIKGYFHCALFGLYGAVASLIYIFFYETYGGGATFRVSLNPLPALLLTARWLLAFTINSAGFFPLKPSSGAVPIFPFELSAVSWSVFNGIVLLLLVGGLFVVFTHGIKSKKVFRFPFLIFLCLFCQAFLIAFMVSGSQGESAYSIAYFLGQARYYYLASILIPIALCYRASQIPRSRNALILGVALVGVSLVGNILNSTYYFKALQELYAPDAMAFSEILSQTQDERQAVIQFHETRNSYCKQ